jgi:hypothetical protein
MKWCSDCSRPTCARTSLRRRAGEPVRPARLCGAAHEHLHALLVCSRRVGLCLAFEQRRRRERIAQCLPARTRVSVGAALASRPANCTQTHQECRAVGLTRVDCPRSRCTNRCTKVRAVSATSRHPWSMTSECPRSDISTISVTPSLRFCFLNDALDRLRLVTATLSQPRAASWQRCRTEPGPARRAQ